MASNKNIVTLTSDRKFSTAKQTKKDETALHPKCKKRGLARSKLAELFREIAGIKPSAF